MLSPAIGLATSCIVLGATALGVRVGTVTGTESGKLSVSHVKNLEAVGRGGRELLVLLSVGRGTSEVIELVLELIIFSSGDKTTLCAFSTEFWG